MESDQVPVSLFSLNWAGLGHTQLLLPSLVCPSTEKIPSEKTGNSKHKPGAVYLLSPLLFLT